MPANPITEQVERLLRPRLIICIAGTYPDGSEHCLALPEARRVIQATRTHAIVVHLPVDLVSMPKTCIPIDDLASAFLDEAVPLLNTSRATDARQARKMIDFGLSVFRGSLGQRFQEPPLVKLEILDQNLAVLDSEVLRCLEELPEGIRGRTLPILSPRPENVRGALELGCPGVRLLTGRIGHRTGVLDRAAVTAAVAASQGKPVTFEGGLDSPAHVHESAQLGASGVLINSAFVYAADPVARARELRRAADEAWGTEPEKITTAAESTSR